MTTHTREDRNRMRGTRTASLVLLVFLALGFAAAPAGAAPAAARGELVCDPTGEVCHPPTPDSSNPECSVSDNVADPGQTITGHIQNVPDGSGVTVTFDGKEVGSGTAQAQNGATTGSADIDFTIPFNPGDGPHTVTFSGAGISCSVPVTVNEVAGEQVNRGGSSLVRTGINVLAYIALGVTLLFGGIAVQRASRRRALAAKYANRSHLR